MASPKKSRKDGDPVELTGQAVRHLRGLGHALAPVVSIGKQGITDALVQQTAGALLRHELVKVRVQGEAPVDRKEAGPQLAAATGSSLAQVLGRTFLLYKRHPEKPRILLPAKRKSGPASPAPAAERAAAGAPEHGDDEGDEDDGEM